jgi:hypothetical protein
VVYLHIHIYDYDKVTIQPHKPIMPLCTTQNPNEAQGMAIMLILVLSMYTDIRTPI